MHIYIYIYIYIYYKYDMDRSYTQILTKNDRNEKHFKNFKNKVSLQPDNKIVEAGFTYRK